MAISESLADLTGLPGPPDLILECSADLSAHARYGGSPERRDHVVGRFCGSRIGHGETGWFCRRRGRGLPPWAGLVVAAVPSSRVVAKRFQLGAPPFRAERWY